VVIGRKVSGENAVLYLSLLAVILKVFSSFPLAISTLVIPETCEVVPCH